MNDKIAKTENISIYSIRTTRKVYESYLICICNWKLKQLLTLNNYIVPVRCANVVQINYVVTLASWSEAQY